MNLFASTLLVCTLYKHLGGAVETLINSRIEIFDRSLGFIFLTRKKLCKELTPVQIKFFSCIAPNISKYIEICSRKKDCKLL